MNKKIEKIFLSTKRFLEKRSPEILIGIGITGFISSTIMAVKATPEAMKIIDEETEYKKKHKEEIKTTDKIKVAWKPYVPSLLLSTASATCIIGASRINYKRNAAIATAYALSERTLTKYRNKVVDILGPTKEEHIHEKIAQDSVDKNKVTNSQIVITPKGNTLCMDSISGRYFKSDIDIIKKCINEINHDMMAYQYVSLNDFYDKINLPSIKNGDDIGWNASNGLIEAKFSTCLTDNDEPCIVLDYDIQPKYGFDNLI